MILYHGSPVGGLKELAPFLSEHGRPYLYFADNPLVALLYAVKPVPKPFSFYPYGFAKDGAVVYSEYYENAFADIYKGKRGYLYACRDVQGTEQPTQINCAYTCTEPVKVDTVSEIPDLYAFFKEQERAGRFRVKSRQEISDKEISMAVSALREDMLQYNLKEQPEHAMSIFLQSHFPEVWGEKEKMQRMEENMSALVEIRDVCKIYNPGENEVRALDHVNVSVEEGEFVAIIGQSGSGKSTLMNILGCLDVPTSGTYMLHGQDVSGFSDNELSDVRNREIGFVFQGFNLIQNLTALENVELPLIYRGVPRAKRLALAKEALAGVGLSGRMEHKPSEMSGGQQQRVAIARAIAQAPPVILADEPTGNLDSGSTKEIMEIMKTLHKEGRTVILITHDNEIAAQAERIIKIKDGHIESDSAIDGGKRREQE